MTKALENLAHSTPHRDTPSDPRSDAQGDSSGAYREQPKLPYPVRLRGLSDHQAVIAAMITKGFTCQDIAFELLLPLRTVRGYLQQALRILNLVRVEDLTYEAITEHYARNLAVATAPRREQAGSTEHIKHTELVVDDHRSNSLAALDAAEASHAQDGELTEFAALALELAATRAQLDQERDTVRQLHRAVDSRDTIGQAKGILMERRKISADAAFTVLEGESNHRNRKLVDVARDLIYSGEEVACLS